MILIFKPIECKVRVNYKGRPYKTSSRNQAITKMGYQFRNRGFKITLFSNSRSFKILNFHNNSPTSNTTTYNKQIIKCINKNNRLNFTRWTQLLIL